MKRQAFVLTVLGALFAASCSGGGSGGGTSTNPFIQEVATALGGVSAVQNTKTLVFESVIEGDGESYWIGENRNPDADLPVFRTMYRWAFNWDGGQYRKQELEVAQFVSSNDQIRSFTQGIDGEIAYDVGIDLKSIRLPEQATRQRKLELRMHPIGIVRAALDPETKIGPIGESGGSRSTELTLKDGSVLTMKVDATTKLPSSVSAKISHPILGDVVHEIEFSDYSKNGGVMLPSNFVIKLDNKAIGRFRATTQTVNFDPTAPVPDSVQTFSGESASAGNKFQGFDKGVRLQVPAVLVKQPAQPRALYMGDENIASMPVQPEVIAPGVWLLKGGDYFSALVEFDDHLTLIEAPVDDARFDAIVAKAAELAPNKKITELVITHHHFDHLGGVRAAIAAGLTLYVRGESTASNSANPEQGRAAPSLRPTSSFFEDLATRPHTIMPDALQKAPKPAVIKTVGDKLVMSDKTRTLELYPIDGSEYADTLLMAYLPKEKILVEADVFTPPADIYNTLLLYPFAQNLIDNINAHKLKVEKIVPLHGHVVTYEEMQKALTARRQDPNAGSTPPQ
jgi:glyoxylase-like metal-dependent hydrolase (beta-lactamase superfamily II)